ncbi:chaperonin alpha subunit, putative [Trypanosoma cruzi]|uniref:T-complex protein 1 subunit alpha n=1 Tax=Trypanosoma cruzi Dm28c TaxID=1416333 RepID=V5B5Q0_TRYCR|nr:chaperonin alpha subunit, putative [Trypanosoma cruzi]ESS68530.1 chaperonin alpha subunit [Trypanosoma cruzi Dm28c]PBJ80275.1 chaperonin alpha subunit [Trypanosoma cruzi cruzi]
MQTKQKQTLGINGSRTSGLSVRRENVTAAMAVANIVKSSLGPIGLDKMLVDDVGDVCVTNDGATILKSLDVEHPAARLLVDLAQLQDKEIGDGTTSVVILASELLKRAQDLIVQGIHATSIIAGYKLALREAVRFLKENLSLPVDGLGKDVLLNIARTSMSSKILSSDADLFAKIVVDAILSVKTVNELGDVVYPRKAVSVLLQHGKSSRESALMQGFALGLSRAAQGMPTSVQNARIALIDFDLRAVKMKLGINITITDPNKAEAIRQRELDITKERIKKMLAAGANVILTSWGIEDSMMKYMVDEGVLGVRRVKKDDMRRIAKVTGAQVVHTLSDLEGEEVFDPKWLGKAERVYEQRFGEDDVIIISGTSNAVCSSIICRGANYLVLEEMERALNDALWAVARTLEASRVLAGGGAVEVALSVYLENFAHTLGSREQLAIAAFSEALLVIPKTLALNAAMDATELVARLRVLHNEQQAAGKSQGVERFFGLELIEGTLRNNVEAGVLEPQPSKIKSLHFATEAAITILRIDDCVRLNPEEEEERR